METASSAPRVQAPKRSGVVVPHKAKWHQRLAAALAYGLIRCLAATIRFELEDRSGVFKGAPAEKMILGGCSRGCSSISASNRSADPRAVAGHRPCAK